VTIEKEVNFNDSSFAEAVMHLNWVLVANKMQSLRHGFAKRTTRISSLLTLRFKCRTAHSSNSINSSRIY